MKYATNKQITIQYLRYLIWVTPIFFFSCASHPEFVYLQNTHDNAPFEYITIDTKALVKIQPFDFLFISVYSIDPLAALPFNPQAANGAVNAGGVQPEVIGYKVGEDGMLDFPIIGRIKVVGLSLREAETLIQEKVALYLKDPVVSIKFLNLKVTVIGEVNRPGTFDIPVENMTILQAIGLAGDVSIYGNRANIVVIREQNGERTVGRLNLLKTDIFNSPFYFLQQNDVIIAQPSVVKDTQINALTSREVLPWVSAGVSFLSLLIAILR
ncbi:MAG: polysaccharide biosynthesis/export family protein [Bacteroidota bacterium]